MKTDSKNDQPLPNFLKLWNFGNPAETEKKFREILPLAETSNDSSYLAQLLTQIARTEGLQDKFEDAHTTLDRVEKMVTPDLSVAQLRYFLERGRVFNSSLQPDNALPYFIRAYELGEKINEMKLAIDAIHMVAIAKKDPQEQVEWNLKGIAMAETNPDSRGWLSALYNNIGESYLLLHDYENARMYFHKLIEFQKEKGGEADIFTIKDEAKAIRHSGHPQEARDLLMPVLEKLLSDKKDNGWIREEIAESLYASGKIKEAKPHFMKAFELLSKKDYCIKNEQQKLNHLKEMAE